MAKTHGRFLGQINKANEAVIWRFPDTDTVFNLERAGQIAQLAAGARYDDITGDKDLTDNEKAVARLEVVKGLVLGHCKSIDGWLPDDPTITDKTAMAKALDGLYLNQLMKLWRLVCDGKTPEEDEADRTDQKNG